MVRQPLTFEQANAVYDVLAKHAGAPDGIFGESAKAPVPQRAEFVFQQSREFCSEYRFQGSLGFGGKFWRLPSAFRSGADVGWYVTAYPEDVKRRPELQQVIDDTNAALAALKKQESAA